MRAAADDEEAGPHPRNRPDLVGHAAAERALLAAYAGGRMPHAWLIGGPPGIGKATLAYRLARFVLAHPDPRAAAVQDAPSLAVDCEHRAFRWVAAQAHPDLLVLERTANERGNLRTAIAVDDARRTVNFFGSTAAAGGWRVCIVDTADDLNNASANALLKIIEEPPARSLLLLVSHVPGRQMSTIRSRCRRLMLAPLSAGEVAQAAAGIAGSSPQDADIRAAAAAADGSVGAALALLDGSSLALRRQVGDLLQRLPALDPQALHALGDAIAGTDPAPLAAFVDTVRAWLSAQLAAPQPPVHRLAQVAEVWDKVTRAAQDVETYNLERKPLVFSVFGLLADTARR